MTPLLIRRQINRLYRIQSEVRRQMYATQNTDEAGLLFAEMKRIDWLIDRLETELLELVELRAAQAQTIEEAERILEIGH